MCSTCDIWPTWIASIEGWPVLSLLVRVNSSSCKGTSGILHIMWSNTLMSPLHCVINLLWSFFTWFYQQSVCGTNFLLKHFAQPSTNFCRGSDKFGLDFRHHSSVFEPSTFRNGAWYLKHKANLMAPMGLRSKVEGKFCGLFDPPPL